MKKRVILLLCVLLLATCALAACSGAVCTVTLDANGGTVAQSTVTARSGEKLKALPSAQRDGWFFGGWYTQADGGEAWDFGKDTVNGNMTLYAHWHSQGVTVTYDLSLPQADIEHSAAPQSVLLAKGALAIQPVAPTADGYIFRGWRDYGGNAWDFSSSVEQDTTLYAVWVKSYEVTFERGDGRTSESVTIAEGDPCDYLPGVTRNGYIFGGWMSDSDGIVPFERGTVIQDDITLYAKWYAESNAQFFSLNEEGNVLKIDVRAVNSAAIETLVLPNNINGIEYASIQQSYDDDYNVLLMSAVKKLILTACVQQLSLSMFPNLDSVEVDYNSTYFTAYKGALYGIYEGGGTAQLQLTWAPEKRGYTELHPQVESIYVEGVFFIRGFNEELRVNLSANRILIVEDEHYADYYAMLEIEYGTDNDALNFLMRLSDYETHGAIIVDGMLFKYIGESEIFTLPQGITQLGFNCLPNYVNGIHLSYMPSYASPVFYDAPLQKVKVYIDVEIDIDGFVLFDAFSIGQFELIVLSADDKAALENYMNNNYGGELNGRFTVTVRDAGVANA